MAGDLIGSALLFALLAGGQAGREARERIVLCASNLIDVAQGTVVVDAVVVIDGGRIVAAGARAGVDVPADAKTLDLGEGWLLPGLVDAHVHLAWGAAADAAPDAPPPGTADALTTLRAGFTTVRNLGSTGYADLLLRDAIEAGRVPGPRMLVAGPGLGAPGGTCARVFAGEGVVAGPAEARAKVRELAEHGVDWIKFCAGGGVLATSADEDACELPLETMRALVEEAHARSLRVAVHAQGPRAITAALEAGVDSIEHGAWIDEAAARAMKARGIALVPTLYRLDWALEQAEKAGNTGPALVAGREARDLAREHVARAIELGVPIVLGTDATTFPHGLNAHELGVLVEL